VEEKRAGLRKGLYVWLRKKRIGTLREIGPNTAKRGFLIELAGWRGSACQGPVVGQKRGGGIEWVGGLKEE